MTAYSDATSNITKRRSSAVARTLALFPATALAPTAANSGAGRSTHSRHAPIAWRDVLRVLATDETRARVLASYRAGINCKADQFQHHRQARASLVEALVSAEDWLEREHRGARRDAERVALRDVRRALEWELWP